MRCYTAHHNPILLKKAPVSRYKRMLKLWIRRDMFEKKLFLVCVIVLLSYVTGYIPASAEDAGEETNGWVAKADLPEARYKAATAVYNGKIYIFGGNVPNKKETFVYDPRKNTWTQKADMPTARYAAAAAVVDGKIYVIGGQKDGFHFFNTVEVYDPATDSWENAPDLPESGNYTSAEVIDKKIYVILDGKNYSYDINTKKWTKKNNMPVRAIGTNTASLNGKIYAVGGMNGAYTKEKMFKTLYEYNPETDSWTKKQNLISELTFTSVTTLNGKIYIMGGVIPGDKATATTQVYDPSNDSIEEFKSLNSARCLATAATVGNDIYIIGGRISNGDLALKTVEMYTPEDSTPDTETPETPTTPEPTPDQSSGDRALLVITMTNGLEKEFDLSMDEVNDFISWYDQKDAGSGSSKYAIDKHDNNKGPFSSRKDYVIFNNILTFEVNEYSSK
ncbi:Kelch repeat-containing protein [Bacillus sp. NSP9.1]|uniref:Kelch repeat-containing protein n=1 Tax=Bacillus sp. NSP9.1 TaxID=1071078 RepID=UPI0004156A65|nr:kelch-like protein [Bacillus sp. NSP9.1]QHZ45415.1 DUF1668 domain-containing protein [Bacillus sp. NSP9.1]